MIKITHSPDIHLYDKEIGISRGYPEESIKILDIILEEYEENQSNLITLGGDLQHAKITKTYYTSMFQKKLKEMGMRVRENLISGGLLDKIKVIGLSGEEIDISEREGILFSVRGQHDTNTIEEYTFFDLLIDNDILINPRLIIIDNKVQINFINYTKSYKELLEPKREGVEKVISIYHNGIVGDGVFIDDFLGATIDPLKYEVFNQVDLALINDIHLHIPTYELITGATKTTVVTPGSMGRTSFNKSHDRDFGHLVNIDISDPPKIKHQLIPTQLTPSDEFFNKRMFYQEKIKRNAFENFCIGIEEVEVNYFDIKEEIAKLNLPAEIQDICLKIISRD